MTSTKKDLLENTRKKFPVLRQYIYANTASAGLLSDDLMQWRQEHDLDYLIGGSDMKTKAMLEFLPEVRRTIAKFFGAKPENTSLVQNFSLGLNLLLDGLDAKHNILLVENDYPSVNWPFESRDFSIFYAKQDAHLEENIHGMIKKHSISVLALSLVQWVNGIRIDVNFLNTLKRDFPDLIIIADGTQFCGTTDFSFEDSGIDVLGGSGYKWLLGGYGNGFFLFTDGMADHFSLKTTGFNAVGGDVSKRDTIRLAKQLEPGHLDTLNFGSLKFSLEYLESLGKKNIAERLEEISKAAKEIFSEMGLLDETVKARTSHSTIFNIEGNDSLFKSLKAKKVMCSQRGGGIRLSFHFYNTKSDLEAIVKILKTAR